MVERIVAAVLAASVMLTAAYWAGGAGPRQELMAMSDAAKAADAQHRKKEREAYEAQQTIVERFNAIRAADRAEWMHDNALRYRRMPEVRTEPGSVAEVRRDCVEGHGAEGNRVLPGEPPAIPGPVADAIEELKRAEEIERVLGVCQQQLAICRDLR